MPLDRAVMDFHTVGLVDTPDGRRLRVIVVVTEKEGVERLLDTLKMAGLKPEGIDLSIFAVIRALTSVSQTPGPVLYAQLGDLVNIAIAESGDVPLHPAGAAGTGGRPRASGRDASHPHRGGADRASGGSAARARSDRGPAAAGGDQDVFALLGRIATELGSELRAAAEFYSTQFGSGIVSAGIVTGQLAPVPGFVDSLAAASGLELVCGEVTAVSAEALGGVDRPPRARRQRTWPSGSSAHECRQPHPPRWPQADGRDDIRQPADPGPDGRSRRRPDRRRPLRDDGQHGGDAQERAGPGQRRRGGLDRRCQQL